MPYTIGLTGSFGSGCTYLAKQFIETLNYKYYSLSDILKDLYRKSTGLEPNRQVLQDFGNDLRKEHGSDYLAKLVFEQIKKDGDPLKRIIDSIRNPNEISFLRRSLPDFYLVGVYANRDIRLERSKTNPRYSDPRIFDKDDERDKGQDFEYGQRVTDCFHEADIIIANDNRIYPNSQNYNFLKEKIHDYIKLIEGIETRVPTEQEALMVIAYANSQRSNCLKRKVGAIIIDATGHILGSGYNEVPSQNMPCKAEYGECYRGFLRRNWADKVKGVIHDPSIQQILINYFNEEFKILDYCKSLHAEESAILSIAKNGSNNLQGATLYTSTYPCNLCANKIIEVGIQKIYYFEPYPMAEAKQILSRIAQIPFEGVTYNGYFNLFKG